jgi:hypothetical protein
MLALAQEVEENELVSEPEAMHMLVIRQASPREPASSIPSSFRTSCAAGLQGLGLSLGRCGAPSTHPVRVVDL